MSIQQGSSEKAKLILSLDGERILFRKIVAPNLQQWFKTREHTIDYNGNLVKYLRFDYIHQDEKQALILITESKIKTYDDRWMFRRFFEKFGSDLSASYYRIATVRSLSAEHCSYNREELLTVVESARTSNSSSRQFKELLAGIDLDKEIEKNNKHLQKLRELSRKKRAATFTSTEQKKIATALINLICEKTDNYLLKMNQGNNDVHNIDSSGQTLLDAMSIFNIEKEGIIDALLNHHIPAARRFAAVFASNNVAALIDKDERVRIAAKSRRNKG